MEDWRRIDIDALEPENRMSEQDLLPPLAPVNPQEIAAKSSIIRNYLSSGRFVEAVKEAVNDPPYGGDDETKLVVTNSLFDVFTSIRQTEITGIVKSLSSDEQDVLVKYLYKLMSIPKGQAQSGVLLNWFDKTIEITGLGPISRYMNDRRTV